MIHKKANDLYNRLEEMLVPMARHKRNIKKACLVYCELKAHSEPFKEYKKHWMKVHKFVKENY